jgi:hypothetical protein
MNYVSGPQIVGREDPIFFYFSKVRRQVFQYNSNQIRAMRLTRDILCDLIKTVNSDYGFQILSGILCFRIFR